ncbi:hypothetical protein [Pyxidicoccus caerfyrddinensis]|uniref:hypothetical protein n=1 Tax=Pyxidicoccus caerfyrddinensis TaxID=2709663 RepID=UPI0013DD09EA|nr:hypothetical protein [Pyxidicoccus caerfyrddinensis]
MRSKWAGCLLAGAFLGLTGCQGESPANGGEPSLDTQEARAASTCVNQFNGIQSCALGAATLARTEEGLEVSGLRDPKSDGVSSNFDRAVRWSQQAAIEQFGTFALAARDGDQVVSTLQVAHSKNDNQFTLTPGFTGSSSATFTVNVYRDGVIQSSTGPFNRWIQVKGEWIYISWTAWSFYQVVPTPTNPHPSNVGACVWGVAAARGSTFTVNVAGKDVVGDSIEFVENIAAGAYPYHEFTGIDVRGSASGYTVLSESFSQE